MGFLDRKKLLEKEELKITKVEFSDGNFTFVRQMTAHERDKWEESLVKETKLPGGKVEYKRDMDDFRAKIAVCTLCDEKGNLLLHPSDYATLSDNMTGVKLYKIVEEAQKLNNVTEEDRENLVKNSDAAQSGNSNSDSVES
jgi:hypothetical protein